MIETAQTMPRHATLAELEAGLSRIRESPAAAGTLAMIVARPSADERIVLERGRLDVEKGLERDRWHLRGHTSRRTQLTLMSARVIELVAGERRFWPLAGDQLYVDLDLGSANLPPGARLSIGPALIEVSDEPHMGCAKFRDRFGADALKLVNGSANRPLRLRGINAFVVEGGEIAVGDAVTKVSV